MDINTIITQLETTPIIAAIKDEAGLENCVQNSPQVVFVLYGTVVDIPLIIDRIHSAGKTAIVHIDLVDGLAPREISVDYIAQTTKADGIISTKQPLVKRAKELNLITIRRFFLLDSMAFINIEKQLTPDSADLIEVLPGIMPKMMRKISQLTSIPLIAGGLITDKEDVVNALSSGAIAVSTTNTNVWNL